LAFHLVNAASITKGQSPFLPRNKTIGKIGYSDQRKKPESIKRESGGVRLFFTSTANARAFVRSPAI
jgi:hypothetical protein